MATDDDSQQGFDPKRRLCPDGSCIGVIGSDGRCTVCGERAADAPAAGSHTPATTSTDSVSRDDEQEDADDPADDHDGASPAFDPKRRLCSDGRCIGVIGHNNRCSVCGRPADS